MSTALRLVFRTLLVAAAAAVGMAAAVEGGPPPAQAGAASAEGGVALFPPEGAEWHVELNCEDGRYLMALFLDALSDLWAERLLPTAEGPPEACARAADAPVFVTIYPVDQPLLRVMGRGSNLAESVLDAARRAFRRGASATDPGKARVRIDIVRTAEPMSVAAREAFAATHLSFPVGVALLRDGAGALFLPPDIAGYRASTNLAALQTVCKDAGLPPDAWREPSTLLWRLTTVGFVNPSPGSHYALPSPDGLTPVPELTVADILRASRLAGGYLLRATQPDGSFVTYWDPANHLKGGCSSVPQQAAATGALAALCSLRPRAQYVEACYDALSWLMQFTDVDERNRKVAFTHRQETCATVWELEATAQVLEAMCRYRRASARTEPDDWIAALARFLLSMQREDGLFDVRYDADTGQHFTPRRERDDVAPQAKAVLALCLAHRELGLGRFLSGARKALERLREADAARRQPYSAEEARWLVCAVAAYQQEAAEPDYRAWARAIAAARRRAGPWGTDRDVWLLDSPPSAGEAADDLVVFTCAAMMDPAGDSQDLQAARRAGRYLARLQFTVQNSYYMADPRGGFRQMPGSNLIRLQTVEAALRGFVRLARLELEGQMDDRESSD